MKIIEMTCPKCGANLDGKEKQAYCEYCGTKLEIDDESININYTYTKRDEARIREAEVKERIRIKEMDYKEREDKRTIQIILACFLVPLILAGGIKLFIEIGSSISDGVAIMQGHILAGNAEDYIGQNYEAVVAQLEERGFTNIAMVDLNDSGILFWIDGNVTSISIEGESDFTDSQYFNPNAKIIITHH